MKPARSNATFSVRGILLSEARSIPPGAFAVHGMLTVTDDMLTLVRPDGPTVRIPRTSIVASRSTPDGDYVEWTCPDGIVSGLSMLPEDPADGPRLAGALRR